MKPMLYLLAQLVLVLGCLSLLAFASDDKESTAWKDSRCRLTDCARDASAAADADADTDTDGGGVDNNATTTNTTTTRPNLVFILSDQLMFNALGFVQKLMKDFDGKLHIQTPNIDALAERGGIYFENAYCVSPVCSPARTSIKTGTTVQRHGVLSNAYIKEKSIDSTDIVKTRIDQQVSFEQVLVEQHGYIAENYGKWHTPLRLYFENNDTEQGSKKAPAVRYTYYNSQNDPAFRDYLTSSGYYPQAIQFLVKKAHLNTGFRNGSQYNPISHLWYTPAIRLDSRYGYPTNTSLTKRSGFETWQLGKNQMYGVDNLPDGYSESAITAKYAIKALRRLASDQTQPFVLSLHFTGPHPPTIASATYARYYLSKTDRLFVSPSIKDSMINSAYRYSSTRKLMKTLKKNYPFDDKVKIAEYTALYYAMIAEIDYWVGQVMETLDQLQVRNQTIVIFTSDHGNMLGAHGLTGKKVLLEDAARVPLIMSLPPATGTGTTIHQPISQLDLHSTILDYLGASSLDQSDGTSLRRFIEGLSYNKDFDESIVVVEADFRRPTGRNQFNSKPGQQPNFMVRKDNYKLILTKLASSDVLDMMYNLEADTYEMNNLIGKQGENASDQVIGKAEHLKALLLEWLGRMDGPEKYYSNPKYNLNFGRGDIAEISDRRTWRKTEYWESDETLSFGPLVLLNNSDFVRNEYFYVGRSQEAAESLHLTNIHIEGGEASQFFSVDPNMATINNTGYVRLKVSLVLPLNATIVIDDVWLAFETNSLKGNRTIPIILKVD